MDSAQCYKIEKNEIKEVEETELKTIDETKE